MEDGKEYFEETWETGESVHLGIVTLAGQWTAIPEFEGVFPRSSYMCVSGEGDSGGFVVVVVVYSVWERARCAAGLFLS